MHLTLNPFRWRKLAVHYASLYARQARMLIEARRDYASLAAENRRLANELKQQNDRLAVIAQMFPQPQLPSVLWQFGVTKND